MAWTGGDPLREEIVNPSAQLGSPFAEKSEAWLLGRARELVAVVQGSDHYQQQQCIAELNNLLEESLRRAQPRAVGQMLHTNILARLSSSIEDDHLDPLMDAMLALARRHGLVVLDAGTHALRSQRALLAGAEDTAVNEIALALAMLDEEPIPDLVDGPRSWQRLFAAVLIDIGLTLTELGVYEEAERVMIRADAAVQNGGGPHEIAVHLINRVRLQLSWALWLERINHDDDARERFATAAAMATAAEGPFRESLFPRDRQRSAADQIHALAAAHALAAPGEEHLDRLLDLLDSSVRARDLLIVAIAMGRGLGCAGRIEEAIEFVADVRTRVADDYSEPALRLSLLREFAHLCGPDGGERTTSALEDYAAELETQLAASARGSRIATLNARREHERMAREHGVIALQAMQDPLTGLPNRRALDERLGELVTVPTTEPVAVALVDLDRFKAVNDGSSHADGDDVLRVVASTLRNTLRGGDLVARYGGDEFVALLPGAPLHAAEAALARAASAVANLPGDLARGVTLSVGVVSLRPHETADEVLSRADAAMYLAKRAGGNAVRAVTGNTGEHPVVGGEWLAAPARTGAEAGGNSAEYGRDGADSPSHRPTWVVPDAP